MPFNAEAIKSEHVLEAASKIDAGEYPTSKSTGYNVIINGRSYPPKEILRLAYTIATGNDIGKIYGGESTNKHLRKLGFIIKPTQDDNGYTWVPVYKKIVEKLFDFEYKQPGLIKIIKNAGITEGLTDKTEIGDVPLSEIDPFTFFSYIHKVKNIEKRKEVVYRILEQLEIEADISDFDGVPTSNAFLVWYFGYQRERKADDIPTMWELFKQAVAGAILDATYNRALTIATVKTAKLTTGLFVINPEKYLPINGQTIPFLAFNGIQTSFSNLVEYQGVLDAVTAKFQQPFYIVSHRSFLENTKKRFWRIGTSDTETSYWEEMAEEGNVKVGWPKIGDLRTIPKVKRDKIYELLLTSGYSYKGSNSTVSRKAGEIWSFYKEIEPGDYVIAQDGHKILGIGLIQGDYYFENGDDFPHHRKVEWLVLSKEFPEQTEGNLSTVHEIKNQLTKNELIQFIEEHKQEKTETDKKQSTMIPLNQILYGPPGTGKTYNSINHALAIIDGTTKVQEMESTGGRKALTERFEELRKQGLIEFITFHQNYSYEEFVQGLRPKTESANQLVFEKRDGIFKKIADDALKNLLESTANEVSVDPTFEEVFEDFFKPLIDETGPISVQMESVGYQFILTKYNPELDNIDFTKKSGGTGHAIFVPTLKRYFDEPGIEHTQGLKSYYKPLAKAMLNRAAQLKKVVRGVERKKYVLIIDEINRANISRVFGELITLLEEDKRWDNDHKMKVKLPSGDEFTVPKNLYIIGTMNTADKSIALLDIALRRRFDFVAMYPDVKLVKAEFQLFFKVLNEAIHKELSADFAIGHSYLMETSSEKPLDFTTAMNKRIIPLLNEYFYSAKEGKVMEVVTAALSNGNIANKYELKEDALGILSISTLI